MSNLESFKRIHNLRREIAGSELYHTRDAYGKMLAILGKANEDIVTLDADLSSSTKTAIFGKEFPDRFFNMGIAEANMVGMAAGLATTGKTVFASTFSIFLTGRVYDQIRQSIAYPKLNVNLVATHAGITVGGDGASHQMLEDIALMRALPNMRVVIPADAMATTFAIEEATKYDGPVYVRLGRGNWPVIYGKEYEDRTGTPYHFHPDRATVLTGGADIAIIAVGLMVNKALGAARMLEKEGISARVIDMHCTKPIDSDTIIKAARDTGGIITTEEHSTIGGLGNAVASVVVENYPVPMSKVAVPDVFGESGESDELMEKYGLTSQNILREAHRVMKRIK